MVFTITTRYQRDADYVEQLLARRARLGLVAGEHLVVGDVVVGAGPAKETHDPSLLPVALYAGTDGFYVSGPPPG